MSALYKLGNLFDLGPATLSDELHVLRNFLAAPLRRYIRDPYGPAVPPSNHGRDLP
jgi:hypothetical protein